MTWQLARAMLDVPLAPVDVPGPGAGGYHRVGATPQRVTLLALALRAGNDGRAWPSVAQLRDDTGLSDRGVRYALRALAAVDILTVKRQPNGSLILTLVMPAPALRLLGITPAPSAAAPSAAAPDDEPAAPDDEPAALGADGRRREEEEKYAALTGGPVDGESWGEYRERGGR